MKKRPIIAEGDRLNILQVVPYFYPAYAFGGPVKVAYSISKEVVKRGYSVAVRLVVQGAGELLGFMRDSVSRLKVKNVKIVDRILSRAEVAGLLGQADVLLLPLAGFDKPYRGMCSKLYEYQTVDKPIMCCAEGEPAKYIAKSNSGVVVKPEDSEGLAEALIYLHSNASAAQLMGANGRKYIEQGVTIVTIGSKVKALFMKLREDKHAFS